MASLCKLLELLAPVERPLAEIVGELPESAVVHRQVRCPWARKGAVMRILTERTKGKDVDVTDGIKVYDERGWAQVLPDPDEPLVHVYAEGKTPADGALARGRVQSASSRRSWPARTTATRADPVVNPQVEVDGWASSWFTVCVARRPRPRSCRVEALPDLGTLSDQELRDLIRELMVEEHKVSYERRLLHGKIDILRAELQARLQKQVGEEDSPLHEIDVDKLAAILASKAPPPTDEELDAAEQ